jgi:hypothetical protein
MNERYTNPTKQEQTPLFDTPNGNLFRLTTRGKIALAGAALLVSMFIANELSGSNDTPITTADAITMTVHPGVHLHTSPRMIGDNADGSTNIDDTVAQGEEIIVENPLSATTMGNTGEEQWEGFHVPGKSGIQWINESQLVNQGVLDIKYNGDPGNSINVTSDGKGNYTFKAPDGSTHAAGTSEIISTNP